MKAFVITRDRLTYTRRCVANLAATSGITDVYLIDHGSTYPPMLAYLSFIVGDKTFSNGAEARVHVHWRGDAHPRDVFANGTVDSIVAPGERFVLTDCDVEPPADPGWLDHLGALLDLNPRVVKAGCGLRTDDLPDSYEHADRVRLWEAQFQGFAKLRRDRTSGLAWYDASVDTTLALYRGPGRFALDPSVRSADARFMARHLPWYEDSSAIEQEDIAWYNAHALPGVSMWADPDRYEGTYGLEGSTTEVPSEVRPGLVYAANLLDPPKVTVEVVADADPVDTPTETEWQVTERCACLGVAGCHCDPRP